jgi:hypothetical protein
MIEWVPLDIGVVTIQSTGGDKIWKSKEDFHNYRGESQREEHRKHPYMLVGEYVG